MRDVLPELMQWWESGETIGVGTVVATFRSAPRPAGASMLVTSDGAVCRPGEAAARSPACSMLMNHCGVARKITGVLCRQQCG